MNKCLDRKKCWLGYDYEVTKLVVVPKLLVIHAPYKKIQKRVTLLAEAPQVTSLEVTMAFLIH